MPSISELINRRLLLTALAAALAPTCVLANFRIGQKIADFNATDVNDKTVRLSDFRGRYVVLEWTNPGCPFVQKHYVSGNMQSLQREAISQGVVWLSINSTADGSGDYLTPTQWARWMSEQKASPRAMLVDDDGRIGKLFAARSALHMFILNPQAELIYSGAIDSVASSKVEDIKTATNFVRQGLNEAMAGKPVTAPVNRPYGCPITYRS